MKKLNPIEEAYVSILSGIKVTKYDQPIKEITYLLTEWVKTQEIRNPVKREKLRVKIDNWLNSHIDIPMSKYPKDVLETFRIFERTYDIKLIK